MQRSNDTTQLLGRDECEVLLVREHVWNSKKGAAPALGQ